MCIHFRARGRFPRADRLPPAPPWFRVAWKRQITLCSWTLRSRSDLSRAGFTGAKQGRKRQDRASRGWPRIGDGWGWGGFSLTESAAQAWVSFALFRFASAGFVTALSDRFPVGGPFPCQQRYSFSPARPSTARQPVKCPLYARAIDIFGAAPVGAATAFCRLPVSSGTARIMNLAY